MHPFEELKAYVGFTRDDEERLRALRPHVMPHAPAIAERFYARVMQFPDALAVFEDMAQVERLKKTLQVWIGQALSGPYDDAYYALRLRIGAMHTKIGLPQQYMFTAMNRLMEEAHTIAYATFGSAAPAYAESLRRITDIELAIMLGTYIDAREQGKLERLRDLLVSHLRTAVILVDKERRVATSTGPNAELFVRPPVARTPLADVLRPELVAAADLDALLARATSTGREIVAPRVAFTLAGVAHTVRVAVVPLRHATADALIQFEDLTEALAAEERVRQAEHLAKLGTMAASVAHEIRNPLAGISGTVQFIAGSLPDDDGRVEALREVQDQIARLGTLVGDLLSFSRPITADANVVDLAAVASGAIAQAAASEGRAADVDGQGTACADARLIAQVLLNLVQNAWQAGARIVQVHVADGSIVVDDDGPGIPAEHRAKVFEPFFTTKVRGTGLGLPVAKKMVEAMQGTLAVSSSPLGGARFELRLPRGPSGSPR